MSRAEDEHRREIPKDSIGELIEAARAGSQEAMGELLQRCRKHLLLVAGRELSPRVRVKEAASDVVQETCVDAQQNLLAFAGETRRVLLRELKTGVIKATLIGHADDINALAFSHDGRTLASGSSDHQVKLWSVASGDELLSLTHPRRVTGVAFAPDDQTLITYERTGDGPFGSYFWTTGVR
ncbi:MAG: hypothetical protein GXY83_31620 [Rhodopirellula sp.]|nr:hypothetical protein [Rhodopirellula sp.]